MRDMPSYEDWKHQVLETLRDAHGWTAITFAAIITERRLRNMYDLGFGVAPAVSALRSSVWGA